MINRKNKGFTLTEGLIAYLIVSILLFLASNRINYDLKNQAQNECNINKSLLKTAIIDYEYKINDSEEIENILPGLDYENFEKLLIDKKLLKEPLKPSYESCSFGYINKNKENKVFCKIHGTTESSHRKGVVMPEYDSSLEKPFSSSYNDYRDKIISKKKSEIKTKYLVLFILMLPIFLFLPESFPYNIIIFIIIVWIKVKKKKKV